MERIRLRFIYKNRFSSSHKVVNVIKDFSGRCTNTIKKGKVLYQARICHQDSFREFLSDAFRKTGEKKESSNLGKINDYYNMQIAALMMAIDKKTTKGEKSIDAYKK
jgi:hypothetical protein